MKGRWTKIIFWAAISVSCAVLLVVTLLTAGTLFFHFYTGWLRQAHYGIPEILIALGLTLLPVLILILIIKAIRRRKDGPSSRIVARAATPLASVLLLPICFLALQYLNAQEETRQTQYRETGSTTWVCSSHSRAADYDPETIGETELRLTEHRHSGKLPDWIVMWPGKTSIVTSSFQADTGSIGGSHGIAWLEPDGRHMIALLSFSDLVGPDGPAGMWIEVGLGDPSMDLDTMRQSAKKVFTCGPDLTSIHF